MKKLLLSLSLLAVLAMLVHADNPHGPTVVATVSLLNQSASSGAVTLYTPTTDGDFAIYLNCYASSNIGNSDFRTNFLWTDELQAETDIRITGPGGTGTGFKNDLVLLRATAGNPIQYSTTYNAGTSNLHYNLYLTVVKQ